MADRPQSANRIHRQVFCTCNLEFDPMTYIYETAYKNELLSSRLSKVWTLQTDKCDWKHGINNNVRLFIAVV